MVALGVAICIQAYEQLGIGQAKDGSHYGDCLLVQKGYRVNFEYVGEIGG